VSDSARPVEIITHGKIVPDALVDAAMDAFYLGEIVGFLHPAIHAVSA
jgi:hypothetical protein